MKAKNETKIDKLSTEVIDAITNVKASYGLSWPKFKKCIDEVIKSIDNCEIKQLNDYNQWRKIYNGEIGSSYSFDWWLTLKSIVDQIPDYLDKKTKSITTGIEKPSTDTSFMQDLSQLGIIGTANKLSESKFKPIQCMQDTNHVLYFMGILGSKWVKDINVFKDFLVKIQSHPHGKVKYLMINPLCKSFKLLKSMRGDHLNDESTIIFRELVEEFPCLEAKYYDFIPCFRLIFMDNTIAAVSRYKLDKNNYIKSNQGWEAPHLVITSEGCEWSLFEPFLSYYQHVWDEATDIREVIKK